MTWFVSLDQYWGIVTVLGLPQGRAASRAKKHVLGDPRNGSPTYLLALFSLREPGVAEILPFTLTTSLATPIPSTSSSNEHTITPLTTRGFWPQANGSILGRSKVRSASLMSVLDDGKISWVPESQEYVKFSCTKAIVCSKKKEPGRLKQMTLLWNWCIF